MAKIDEIAPDIYRMSIYVPEINLQFNHFLIKDDEPLLYHTGMRMMHDDLREAVGKLLDPAEIRWIGFSHFEMDECGSLNQWLQVAPSARPVCGQVGALVNMNDYSLRPALALDDGESFSTGQYRFRYCKTPHLPHGWDAGVLFEEKNRTLLCSDLFHQNGDVEALTESEILGRVRETMTEYQHGPLMDYQPYTHRTRPLLEKLAELKPETLAAMHGSSYRGDCAAALKELDTVMKEVMTGE